MERPMSKYKIIVLAMINTIFLPLSIYSQDGPYRDDIRKDRTKPTVYLEFKEYVYKQAPDHKPPIVEGARVRLHNNTAWPLYYHITYRKSLPGDIPVVYIVEQRNGCYKSSSVITDTGMVKNIKPGEVISFVVL